VGRNDMSFLSTQGWMAGCRPGPRTC